jgi:hypothetical protein
MTDKFDHADMIGRLVRHYQKLNKGNDGLSSDAYPPFRPNEVRELRRLASSARGCGIGTSTYEKTGGTPPGSRPPGGWFSELRNLPHDDDNEAAVAFKLDGR